MTALDFVDFPLLSVTVTSFPSFFLFFFSNLLLANHSSILAWRIPWTEEPDGPQSMGVAKSQT